MRITRWLGGWSRGLGGNLFSTHRSWPQVFRHSFAKPFFADNGNDLVSLAQILGHENLNTTSRYSQKSEKQLAAGSERVSW